MKAKFIVGTALGAVVLSGSVLPVAAQQQLRQPRPSVEVDWSVLDEMNQPAAETPQLRAPRGVQTLAPPPAGRAPTPLAAAPPSPVTRAPLVPPAATTTAAAPPQPARVFAPPQPAGNFVPPPNPPTFGDAAPSTAVPVPATPANPLGDTARATQPPPPPASASAAPQPLGRPPVPTLNSSTASSAPPPSAPVAPAPVAIASAPPPAPSAATLRSPQAIAPAPAPAPVAAAPAPAPVAPAPAPVAAPAAPAPAQQAAAAPVARAATDPLGRLNFAAGSAELANDARTALAPVIREMNSDAAARLQLQAYASGGDDQGGQARRLSLSRALAVRGYLIEQGIASTRIDVRALGRANEGPPDRVDLLMVRR